MNSYGMIYIADYLAICISNACNDQLETNCSVKIKKLTTTALFLILLYSNYI